MTEKIKILNLIDFEEVNKLLEGFNQTTGFVTAIIDLQGNVLSKSGWRQICTHFHRINPETSKNCTISDTVLANELENGEKYHFYKCLNGLVDVAVPIIIKGEHIANLFSGQFFFEEPNRTFFKKQAEKYGFNEQKYLTALENVPVVSKEKVKIVMDFLLNMTQLISEITFQKLEQQQSNKALIKSEERFRDIIFSSADWVWEVDKDGKYIYSSQKSIDLFEVSEEEIIGKTPFDFMPEDEAKRVAAIFAELAAKKQPIKDLENWNIGKNGELICLLTNGLPVLNNEGELLGYRGIDKNITERKHFEKELIKAKEKAEKSEKLQVAQKHNIELNNQRLESLLRISQFQTTSVQELLDYALEEAIKLTNSKIGYIYFYDEITHQFLLNTWSKEVMDECRIMNPQTVYDLDKTGCWGEAVRQRKPIVLNDYAEANPMKKGTPEGHVHLSKFLTIPVIFDEKIVAVAGVANKEQDYNSADIRQLTLLMDAVWKISERISLISNLEKAKEKAEESEKKYRAFVEQSSEGIYRMELDMALDISLNPEEQIDFLYEHAYIAECNYWFAKMYGSESYKDLVGIKQIELHNGKNNPINRQALKSFITSNYRLTNIETEEKTKDGKTVIILNSAVGYIENGKLLRYWGIQIDITEQNRLLQELTQAKEKAEESENALKHSHDLMKYIIEHNRSAIAVHDKDYKYIYVSQSYLQQYQVKEKDILGRHHYEVFPDLPQKWRDVHKKALMGEVSSSENDPYYKDDGTVEWTRWECRPWYGRDNSIGGFIVYTEVITDRINIELRLRAAKEKAEESDRLKSAFLANMSHEIRTPMNGILGFTDLLLNPDLNSEEREDFIKIVHKSGQRMLNTVNDIVEISKIEADLVELRNELIDVNYRLEELVQFFTPEAEKKGLRLILEKLLLQEKKILFTDKNKLDSILTNLIKNAIKYTESGTIKVGCGLSGSTIEFYIKDTGIGIPAHRQEAIFNRFEQADIADTRVFEGSGLGLAIAKSYVEMLGGKIWVESEERKGSIFYFTLPIKKNIADNSHAEKTNSSKYQKSKPLNKRLKILIAEDDETSRQYLRILVNDFGREIIEAETGGKALELSQKYNDIDLILMDIKMPLMDGYEATRKIREFNKDVVIIAQTAYAFPGDINKALEAGCNDYISKPINTTKLQSLLQKYFKG